MSRMRVLYLDHTAKMSGGEVALSRLISALTEDVDPVVVLAEEGPFVDRLNHLGIAVHVVPLRGSTGAVRKESLSNPFVAVRHLGAVVAYAFRLRRLIADMQVDVVHTNSLKSGFYGCLAARLAGVPSVWHLRDRLAADYLPRPALMAVRSALAILPSTIICVSEATLSTIRSRPGSRRAKSAVVIHDPLAETSLSKRAKRTAGRNGGHDRPWMFTVGMVGRFAPWKGQLETVRAFAGARLPESRLVFVGAPMFGEHEYERQVRAEAAALRVAESVDFLGHVDDVDGALNTVDVLVHSSLVPEPFGQVLIEGMAAGVPVVATDKGGPSEIITDRVNGLLYPAGDIGRLAALLQVLHRDASLREQLSRGGLRRAQDFAPDRIRPMVLQVYDRLTGGKSATS